MYVNNFKIIIIIIVFVFIMLKGILEINLSKSSNYLTKCHRLFELYLNNFICFSMKSI